MRADRAPMSCFSRRNRTVFATRNLRLATCELLFAFWRHRPWTALVPFLDAALQLFDWLRVVVDLQAQNRVVVQPDAAVLLHDHERCGLLAARVAPSGLAAFEGGDEALRQVSFGALEGLDHVLDDGGPSEDVALRGGERAALMSCPRRCLRPGEGR